MSVLGRKKVASQCSGNRIKLQVFVYNFNELYLHNC